MRREGEGPVSAGVLNVLSSLACIAYGTVQPRSKVLLAAASDERKGSQWREPVHCSKLSSSL